MEINFISVKGLPVAIIDNLYNAESLEKIWHELVFLNTSNKMKDPEFTGSATDSDGNILKQNKAISLDNVYADRNISNILQENRILWRDDVIGALIDYHPFFRFLHSANVDSTLISYYENSDFYKPHKDDAIVTALTWFYDQPKKFDGGDLILEDEVKIECKHNRCLIFPSILVHSVSSINLSTDLQNQNFGRFAMSQFSTING